MRQAQPTHDPRAARIETLIEEVAAFADPAARATAEELVQALVDMYGEGLARLLELTAQTQQAGTTLIDTFARDELVGSLMLLHGLHPDDLPTRIAHALDAVRPGMRKQGGNVDFIGIEGGVARLRVFASEKGCSTSTAALKATIEAALYSAAPDLEGVRVEGMVEPPSPVMFVPRRKKAAASVAVQGDLAAAVLPATSRSV